MLGIVRNRVYLGEARGVGNGYVTRDAHPALIDEATWQAAQGHRVRHRAVRENPGLLRGLVRCGSCRYVMQSRPAKDRRGLIYVCNSRIGCVHPAIVTGQGAGGALALDDVVVEMVREWERERDERIVFEGLDPAAAIEPLEVELAMLEADVDRDRLDDELRAALGRRWVRHLADLTRRVEEKQAEIDERLRQLGGLTGRPTAEFWEKWDSGEVTVDEKREHLARVLQAVFVNPVAPPRNTRMSEELRRRRFRDRVALWWANDPVLVDIPRHGPGGGYVIQPWPFPDAADPDPDVLGVVLLQPPVEAPGEPVG
jgi:hypothetical protein